MSVRRILFVGSMQTPEDCARNPWCSEAYNVTQLALMQALRACGVEEIVSLSLTGSSARHNPRRIQRSKRSTFEPSIEIWELPFIALGPLQPLSQLLSCAWRLARYQPSPDAILIGSPDARLCVPALTMARVWRVPIVIIAADLIPSHATKNIFRTLQQVAQETVTRFAPGVVVFSSHLGHDLRPNRPWVRMVRPSAPDLLEPFELKPDPFMRVAYYAGATTEYAGANLFLQAIQHIQDPLYRFWFSGRGQLDDAIHRAAEHDSRITHWGFVSREKYRELLHTATVLINPRLSHFQENRYNFPSKLMEYMAAGRPIISTATSDIAEHYSQAIVLLDEETPQRLAELIQYVCELPLDEQAALGQRARQHVQDETWEAQARLILDFMESLES